MRNYSYGAFPPVENADLVHHQFRIGCTYQRVLTLIEHERRNTINMLYREARPEAHAARTAASEAVGRAIEAVRLARSTGGDILPPDDEMAKEQREILKAAEAVLEEARKNEKAARQAWWDARRSATPELRERLKELDQRAYEQNKFAYNAAGTVSLDWGTRLKLGESAERAGKAALLEGEDHLPRLPRFDGGGMIAVQLQGGLAPSAAMVGSDTQFRVDLIDAASWMMLQGVSAFTSTKKDGRVVALPQPDPNSKRSLRRGAATSNDLRQDLAIARIRVGSNGRQPIWAAFPILLHRPLPPTAAIKWVQVFSRRIGPRTEWQLIVTVNDTQPEQRAEPLALAVNLGWRNLPDTNGEIRVAYAVGSDGHEEEVRVPSAFVRGMAHVESIASIRKKLFNDAVKMLDDWIEDGTPLPITGQQVRGAAQGVDTAAERRGLPEWLLEAARWRDRWLAQKKLIFFLNAWRDQRFDGDQRMWEVFAAWRKKDKHLWCWESDERLKLLRMRKDFYRKVAARWAAKYAHIFVTDMDLRDFAEKESPEATDATNKVQRVTQRLAAPSELRGAIENAASTRGTCCPRRVQRGKKFVEEGACAAHAGVAERLSAFKTQTCHACGNTERFDARATIYHTCFACKLEWDQDANHCRNLLASAKAVSDQAPPLAPAENTEGKVLPLKVQGRWQKRRSQNGAQVGEKKKQKS